MNVRKTKSLGNLHPDDFTGLNTENATNIQKPGDLTKIQIKAHKTHGDWLKFWLDESTEVLSIADKNFFSNVATLKITETPQKLFSFAETIIGDILERGEESDKIRTHIINNFSIFLVAANRHEIVQIIDEDSNKWISDSSKAIDLQEKLKATALKISLKLLCGEIFAESEKLATAIHAMMSELVKLQFNAALHKSDDLKVAEAYFNEQINNIITARKEKINKNSIKSQHTVFLDGLFELTSDEADIKRIFNLILITSYHKIASVVAWTIYAIADNPEIAKTIAQQTDRWFVKGKINDFSELIISDRLDHIVKEGLRHYPARPYTARLVNKLLSQIDLQDVILFCPIYTIHHKEEYWSRPETFDPGRFKGISDKKLSGKYMPFGFGERMCPGENAAQFILPIMLAKLLNKFNFSATPRFKPQVDEGFVLESKNGIHMLVSHRSHNKLLAWKNHTKSCNKISVGVGLIALAAYDRRFAALLAFILVVGAVVMSFNPSRLFSASNITHSSKRKERNRPFSPSF